MNSEEVSRKTTDMVNEHFKLAETFTTSQHVCTFIFPIAKWFFEAKNLICHVLACVYNTIFSAISSLFTGMNFINDENLHEYTL